MKRSFDELHGIGELLSHARISESPTEDNEEKIAQEAAHAVTQQWKACVANGSAENCSVQLLLTNETGVLDTASQCSPVTCKGMPICVFCDATPDNAHYHTPWCFCGSSPVENGERAKKVTVYWCGAHARVHSCVGSCAMTAYTNSVGMRVCSLSGKIVGASLEHAYGDGTTYDPGVAGNMSYGASSVVTSSGKQRRSLTNTTRAPKPGSVEDVLRTTSVFSAADLRAGRSNGNTEEVEKDFDPDYPRMGLFSDSREANSFGDGIGAELDTEYAQAYATVYRFLFSEERHKIERANALAAFQDAKRRIYSYVRDEVRSQRVVQLSVCTQLYDRSINRGRIFPCILLPRNAQRRLCAYYAMACMEFYLNVLGSASSILSSSGSGAQNARGRKSAERLRGMSTADVYPNVLDVMQHGISTAVSSASMPAAPSAAAAACTSTSLGADWLIPLIFPEATTLKALKMDHRVCTDVKKHLRHVLVRAAQLGVSPPPGTVLEASQVLHDDGTSVVEAFIRNRLLASQ